MALRDLWGRLRGKSGEEVPNAPGPAAPPEPASRAAAAPPEPASRAAAAPPEPASRAAAAPPETRGPDAARPQSAEPLSASPLPGDAPRDPVRPPATGPADASPPPAPPAEEPVAGGATEPGPPAPEAAPRGGLLSRLNPFATRPPDTAESDPPERRGFLARLKAGLSRSTEKLTGSLAFLTRRRLDDAALEELEETLITADLGVAAAHRIVESFRRTRFGKEATEEEIKEALAEEIAGILAPVARPLVLERRHAPHVVLVAGVNGVGKTTTIAKLAEQYRAAGLTCWLVAGDTFRAAAVEQLEVWGGRTGARVIAPAKPGADAAGLAHDALREAREAGVDVLLVDTAGRLHNKTALMDELRKIVRVLGKVDAGAPHSTLLVLDATTGQNAVQQVRVFKEMVDVTGLVVTKLDGSAKGGVVVALAEEFRLPVHAVGVGETAADLRPFDAREFSRSLLGLA